MAITSRIDLKKGFEKGAVPTQEDFYNLIDSMIHKQEDGLISEDDGLRLSPKGSDKKLLSFLIALMIPSTLGSLSSILKIAPNFG